MLRAAVLVLALGAAQAFVPTSRVHRGGAALRMSAEIGVTTETRPDSRIYGLTTDERMGDACSPVYSPAKYASEETIRATAVANAPIATYCGGSRVQGTTTDERMGDAISPIYSPAKYASEEEIRARSAF